MGLGEDHTGTVSLNDLISSAHTTNTTSLLVLTLISWLRSYVWSFSTVKITPLLPFHVVLFARTMHSPHLWCGELFTQSFVYIGMDSLIFVSSFGLNPILCYFVCSNCSSFNYRELFHLGSDPSLTYLHHVFHDLCGGFRSLFLFVLFYERVMVIGALPCFLAPCNAPGLRCVFLSPVLESAIPSRSLRSLSWRTESETKLWAPCVLFTTKLSLLLGPLSWQIRKVCINPNACLYKYFYK